CRVSLVCLTVRVRSPFVGPETQVSHWPSGEMLLLKVRMYCQEGMSFQVMAGFSWATAGRLKAMLIARKKTSFILFFMFNWFINDANGLLKAPSYSFSTLFSAFYQ